jgi:hypothetical protein
MAPEEEIVGGSGNDWIDNEIKRAMNQYLPSTSKERYQATYETFQEWRAENKLAGQVSPKEILAYFNQMLETGKWASPGTFWSKFSMLRTTLQAKEGIDIKSTIMNTTIETWPKKIGGSHKTKQDNMFTKEQVRKFLNEAPDSFIVHKLILLVGVYTGLRCDTLTQLEWRHVRLIEAQVEIFVDYESKTDQAATGMWFALSMASQNSNFDPYVLFSKYKQILEKKNKELAKGRLWIRINENKDGSAKVTRQVRGKE